MPRNPARNDRRGPFGAAAVVALLLMASVAAIILGIRGTPGPPQPAVAAPLVAAVATPGPQAATPGTPAARSAPRAARTPGSAGADVAPVHPPAAAQPKIGPFLAASRPTVLDIPTIGVHATDFVDLAIDSDGHLGVPGRTDEVGFYRDGPSPGQLGTAILAAHVDSTKGPGVFFRLGAIKAGAGVRITRADGSVTRFVVDKVQAYPKDAFPDDVYTGDFTRAEIRLITCGGSFDRSTGHYRDNIVVFGHLTAT